MAHELRKISLARTFDVAFLVLLDSLLLRLERALATISGVFVLGLMMVAVVQIVSRTIFNAPIFGYIDMVEIAMATFSFLAISYTERLGGHVRMEYVLSRFRGRARWLAELLGALIALIVITVLIYYGYQHAVRAYEFGDTTLDAHYPLWPSKALVPIAFSILWLRLTLSICGFARLSLWPALNPVGVPASSHQLQNSGAVE